MNSSWCHGLHLNSSLHYYQVHANKTLSDLLIDRPMTNGHYQNERTKEIPLTLVWNPDVNITSLRKGQ